MRNQTSEGETITGSVKCEENAAAACPIRVFGQGVDVDRDEETICYVWKGMGSAFLFPIVPAPAGN